jgi:hypothetical protein
LIAVTECDTIPVTSDTPQTRVTLANVQLRCAVAHCRGNYYREFGFKTLKGESQCDILRLRHLPVKDERILGIFLETYASRPGQYISVYSFSHIFEDGVFDYNSAKINRLYLDFDDDESPQHAIDEAIMTIRALARHGIITHTYFSGKKGVALYIEFETVEVADINKKEVITQFFDIIKKAVENEFEIFCGMVIDNTKTGFTYILDALDHKVRGDIARLSRIPNTRHASGLYCIPLTYEELQSGLENIKRLAEHPKDANLEDTITKLIIRNKKVQLLIKNLELKIVREREYELQIRERKEKTAHIERRHYDKDGKIAVVDVVTWCQQHGLIISNIRSWSKTDGNGRVEGTLYILVYCPFNSTHKSASIFQDKNGALGFHCFHESCSGNSWKELKSKLAYKEESK